VATAVEPSYYAGGVGVLLRPEQRITDWAAMRGQKLCATQGAYFNRPMSQRYLLDLEMYKSIRDAQAALRDGRCIGFLYSSTAIQSYLLKPEWAGYQAPLPQALLARWAIMLPRKDKGTDFERWMGDRVATWHKEGRLVALERKWRLPPSKFLVDEQTLWATCVREPSGRWPTECRNPTFVRADEVGGLYGLGLWINENLGVNLTVLYDDYDRKLFGRGLWYSLVVMAGAITASLVFGFVGALLVQSRSKLVRYPAQLLAVYGRMTPPLLTMYLLFFGLGGLIAAQYGIQLSAIAVAIVCLSFYTGSLMMNCIVDAMHHLKAVHGHFVLGVLNVTEILKISSRPLKLILINVVKQSVICSALAVPELIFATTSIVADHGNPNVMMNVFVITFLIIITGWLKVFDKLEDLLHRSKKAGA
jgi:polar amino acid transport system substrate-binding protein